MELETVIELRARTTKGWPSEKTLARLRATFVDLLEKIGRQRLEAGESRAALDAAERGLEVGALNESLLAPSHGS